MCLSVFGYFVILQVISIACCVFYSHCGNRTVSRDKSIDRRTASWIAFSLWTKHDDNTLISRLLRMHKFKEQICSSWFAPVGSASDYPLLSKWAIYGEVSILYPLLCFLSLVALFCLLPKFLSLFGTVIFQWIWVLKWYFTSLLFVGYIHWSLHCQLCRRAVNWVRQLFEQSNFHQLSRKKKMLFVSSVVTWETFKRI